MRKKNYWIWVSIVTMALFGECIVTVKSHAQDGWSRFSIGSPKKKYIECSGFSSSNWSVIKRNGKIQVIKYIPKDISIESLPFYFKSENISSHFKVSAFTRLGEYWLLGLDGGEWGGGLWWVSPDGKQGRLLDQNVRTILETEMDPLVLVGLNHENQKYGEVFRVGSGNTGLMVSSIAKLKSAPKVAMLTPEKRVLMISDNSLIQMTLDGKMRKMVELPLFYPNSMAQDDDGSIWIGGRHFVVRVICEKGIARAEWYVPSNCLGFEMKEGRCICEDG